MATWPSPRSPSVWPCTWTGPWWWPPRCRRAGWCSTTSLGGRLGRAHAVELPDGGSQFRSRDFFPALLAELAAGQERSLGGPLDSGAIPPVPEEAVVYVHTATVSDGTLAVADRELSFAPGSSGWSLAPGQERRFYELLLRGGSAAELFGGPAAGARVLLG